MAQHRIMTILLFVCLSLCFEVAQSKLKNDGDPCIYSAKCKSRCCHRDSPRGSGKCVRKSSSGVRCYGPNTGEPCFRSHQCNSGCCMPSGSMYNAVCELKYDKTQGCIGPKDGDFCYSSDHCHNRCCFNANTIGNVPVCITKSEGDKCFGANNGDYCALNTECNSGCCQLYSNPRVYKSGICKPKVAENEECNLVPVSGLSESCPCESGLVCEKDTSRNMTNQIINDPNRRICRKPISK
ncbi:uncharacterized protein [Eleutherodactylus coqui]|uniref:uncharacterized protein n=1 Tax=Eleutherodactylus coqui TaxID=57060 RepID=UPI0034630879